METKGGLLGDNDDVPIVKAYLRVADDTGWTASIGR